MHGDFNACIPVCITNWRAPRVLIRCPIPFYLDSHAIDEKLRCEAAAFLWIPQHCPAVPVPKLCALGLPNGLSVSVESSALHFPAYSISLTIANSRHSMCESSNMPKTAGPGSVERHVTLSSCPAIVPTRLTQVISSSISSRRSNGTTLRRPPSKHILKKKKIGARFSFSRLSPRFS